MVNYSTGKQFTSSGKRLLITFCLDMSPSMGKKINHKHSAISVLNQTVKGITEELSKDKKLLNTVELMFVTFYSEVIDVTRTMLRQYQHTDFRNEPVGGSNIPLAVITSFNKIDERLEDYRRAGLRYHSPIFLLMSDGNPDYEESDATERRAMNLVSERCQKSVSGSVCPFIIGIGDELDEGSRSTLRGYANGFMDGYFHVMGDEQLQSKIAKMIVKLVSCSVQCTAQRGNYSAKTLDLTACEMTQVQAMINRAIQKFRQEDRD